MELKCVPIEIAMEMQNTIELINPSMEVRNGDHVLGMISPDLKKVYTVLRRYSARLKHEAVDLENAGTEDAEGKILSQMITLSQKCREMMDILFTHIKRDFESPDIWGKEIYIRKGFIAVWRDVENGGALFIASSGSMPI